MTRTRLGFRQPLGGAAAVRLLPEDAAVAVAIRLKGDPRAVRRPDREPVVAAEGQASHRAGTRDVMDRDDGLFAIVEDHGEVPAVGRPARRLVSTGRKT